MTAEVRNKSAERNTFVFSEKKNLSAIVSIKNKNIKKKP